MRDRDAFLWFVALLVFASSAPASSSPVPAPAAGPDPNAKPGDVWLSDGVYWWCAAANDAEPLMAWFRTNATAARLVKMLGTNGGDCAVVLFEVRGALVKWTLGGQPEEAPNGVDTTLEDLRGSNKLTEFFRRMAERTIEQIKRFDQAVQQWMQQHMPAPPSW